MTEKLKGENRQILTKLERPLSYTYNLNELQLHVLWIELLKLILGV
jgi:hypothetical protein